VLGCAAGTRSVRRQYVELSTDAQEPLPWACQPWRVARRLPCTGQGDLSSRLRGSVQSGPRSGDADSMAPTMASMRCR